MKKLKTQLPLVTILILVIACTSEQEPLPNSCDDAPTITLTNSTQASCNMDNGSLTVEGTGGNGLLRYALNDDAEQNSGIFNGLAAGSYSITVTDENGCVDQLIANVTNVDGLNINLTIVDTVCGENQGSILVTASGAVGDVEFKINDEDFQSSNSFQNLPQGGYTVISRDDSGCEIEQEVDIKTGVTFGNVDLIVQTNCAVDGCHNGSQAPDLRGANNIIGSAGRIKQRTSNGTMPPGGGLTDQEIATIACWVDDGANGN